MSNSSIWNQFGIYGETYRSDLMFEPYSKNLVAHFYRKIQEDGYGVYSLYARHITEEKYHRITEESDKLSFKDPTFSPVSPHIFVNVMEIDEDEGKVRGYNWNSIRKIDVTSGEVVSHMEPNNFPLAAPYVSGWVSDLYGIATDGETIYCNVGLDKSTRERNSFVEYYVAKLSLEEKIRDHNKTK